jgi:hypothetical protein
LDDDQKGEGSMPYLVKGGKWVFGWVIVSPDGEVAIPPPALTEYSFQAGETAFLIRGSRTSGGFGLCSQAKLADSILKASIIVEVAIGSGAQVRLPPQVLFHPGERLLVVRGSRLALGFIQRGPIYLKAMKHPELEVFIT